MATAKKAAKKKATSTEEAPKQIIMTEEQYKNLCSIKYALDSATDSLRDLAKDSEEGITPMRVGFEIGTIHTSLLEAYGKARDLEYELDPNPYTFEQEEETEEDESF